MKRVKRETTDWEIVFLSYVSDRYLYAKYIKNPYYSLIKKSNFKMGKVCE